MTKPEGLWGHNDEPSWAIKALFYGFWSAAAVTIGWELPLVIILIYVVL
jgi:hypothetical protein